VIADVSRNVISCSATVRFLFGTASFIKRQACLDPSVEAAFSLIETAY
jgi:hypothetical protein